jgi:hypothetical protein
MLIPSNPARLNWADLPDHVHARVGDLAGAGVHSVEGATTGFSPGFAGVVNLHDGRRIFVKAMSRALHPHSIGLNVREAEVAKALPSPAPVARLRWEDTHDDWHLMAFDAMPGPGLDAGSAADLQAAWGLYGRIAAIPARDVRPGGVELATFADDFSDLFDRWALLVDAEDSLERLASLGELGAWITRHQDTLRVWEAAAAPFTAGDALVHGDLRLDNMVRGADTVAVAVDWPWACAGARWLDLAGACCSLALQGAGRAHDAFRSHPLATSASFEAERSIACVLAGFFCHASTEPELRGVPGLRTFQRAQLAPAVEWLRTVAPELD